MMKIISVIGARPQFIKAASVSRMMKKAGIKEVLIHTGQHYDYNMSQVFFKQLKIKEPEYNLGIGSMSHGSQTGRMIEKIEGVLLAEKPGLMLVYGDTNSTLAGSLAAAKLHIPVAHVEAGLRSYNRNMPEEINRVLTDHVSDVLFCPTETAVENLRKEGFKNIVNKGKLIKNSSALHDLQSFPFVINVGDVMYDSVLYNLAIAKKISKIIKKYKLLPQRYYLATIHRAENTDNTSRLKSICKAFNKIAERYPLIFPAHPRTEKLLSRIGYINSNLKIIPPVSYWDMLMLSSFARVILTDSGGLQKEAFFLNVPCVTLRDETEWVETLQSGMNVIAGASEGKILRAVKTQEMQKRDRKDTRFFGDGKAAEKMLSIIKKTLA